MGRRILAGVALALGVAVLAACGVALLGEDDGGVGAVDWATVSPAQVETLIVAGELDVEGTYVDVSDDSKYDWFPLAMLVREKGNPDVADVLVRHGSDLERFVRDDLQMTPLDLAVLERDTVMVQRLLELGADVRQKNLDDAPVMMLAVKRENAAPQKKIMDILLDNGADINVVWGIKGYESATPLIVSFTARDNRHSWVASYLLERGADPNVRPPGSSVLAIHPALYVNDAHYVRLLVQYGADVNLLPDELPVSPLAYFLSAGHSVEILDFLVFEGAVAISDGKSDAELLRRLKNTRKSGEVDFTYWIQIADGVFGEEDYTLDEWRDLYDVFYARIVEHCSTAHYPVCDQLEDQS